MLPDQLGALPPEAARGLESEATWSTSTNSKGAMSPQQMRQVPPDAGGLNRPVTVLPPEVFEALQPNQAVPSMPRALEAAKLEHYRCSYG